MTKISWKRLAILGLILGSSPPAFADTLPTLPPVTEAPTSNGRIGVRVVDGYGQFYNRATGATFVPRGNNYIRLVPVPGLDNWHSTFTPGLYDPAAVESDFAQMQASHYNYLRVVIDWVEIDGGSGTPGLDPEYINNVADLIERARNHGLRPIMQLGWIPLSYWSIVATKPATPNVEGGNNSFLINPGYIEGYARYLSDFVKTLKSRNLETAIFSYELWSEYSFHSSSAPFSLTSGTVEPPWGGSYDLSSTARRQALADDAATYWATTMTAVVKQLDPQALTTMGVFSPLIVGRAGYDGGAPNQDIRLPLRMRALGASTLDYLDLHTYVNPSGANSDYRKDWEMAEVRDLPLSKPIVQGEFGAYKPTWTDLTTAATHLRDQQVASCAYRFSGWATWTWDTSEQIDFWNALDQGGIINQVLAPIFRPDSCSVSGTPPPPSPQGDYSGDGKTDIAVWRPSDATWYLHGLATVPWGVLTDIPVPGDYDGDRQTDLAVWQPSDAKWYLHGLGTFQLGVVGDIPVPGDYNGDLQTDLAVWRPSDGSWHVSGNAPVTWGGAGDIPVPADYSGDGKTDIAVWRPSDGKWYVFGFSTPHTLGMPGDIPVPGDYDGDGKTDFAVWRPSDGKWYIASQATQGPFGVAGDIPIPADYDGDGKTDLAVWRPSDGKWYIAPVGTQGPWGDYGDIPVVNSVITVIQAARLINGASFVSQTVPATMTAGASVAVSVTMRNTGLSAWDDPLTCGAANCGYRLGSQNPQDNGIWGIDRVSVTPPGAVQVGQSRTFNFTVTAPATPGNYNFQWKMVRETIGWFGVPTQNVAISVQSLAPVNQPPTVSAGSDQTITLPSPANLLGSASDDGLPNPPGAVTTTWSKLTGPGTVSFGNVSSRSTTALFSAAGTYTLRLTASDSTLSATDDVIITVKTGPLQNQAPVVNAGSDLMITLPAVASLAGAAVDDHLPNPPNQLTTTWSKLSGPGTVGFGDAGKLITTATFSAQGIYVLRLAVSDGALSASDTLTVNVSAVSGGVLPEPDLSGINGRIFTRNDTLALTYSGNASAFNWEFIPTPSGQASAGVLAHAAQAPVVTATPRFNLSSLSLSPGRYEVRVQAIAAGQQSNWATASITLANDVLAGFRAYPNPVSAARGEDQVIFDRMPANSSVKIFTLSGRYVKSLNAPTGTVAWDLTNDSGDKVASGIYLYLISDAQDGKTRGTLTVIK